MPTLVLLKLATLAGGAGGALALALQQVDPHLSGETILTGALAGISVFLFGMFIRQGNKLAALEAMAHATHAGHETALETLDVEARTVDKRIESARHMLRNELVLVIASVEERVMLRQEEQRERLGRLDERLHRHLEEERPS